VRPQRANLLATDAADPDQLVDGAERPALPVANDRLRLRRSDAGQQPEHGGRRRIQVHDPVDGLSTPGNGFTPSDQK
jgi:hypothetical protein